MDEQIMNAQDTHMENDQNKQKQPQSSPEPAQIAEDTQSESASFSEEVVLKALHELEQGDQTPAHAAEPALVTDSAHIPVIAPEEQHEAQKTARRTGKKKVSRKKPEAGLMTTGAITVKKTELKPDMTIAKALLNKLERVNRVIFDVDGVLTDGSIYITDQGTGLKRFHSQDGHGIKMLLHNNMHVLLLSARQCRATRKRARELGIEEVNTGIEDKRQFVIDYMKKNRLRQEEIAYVGDDLIDLPAMMECGVRIIPANGTSSMLKVMDYQTSRHGGHGAVREVCDMLLIAKGLYAQYLVY